MQLAGSPVLACRGRSTNSRQIPYSLSETPAYLKESDQMDRSYEFSKVPPPVPGGEGHSSEQNQRKDRRKSRANDPLRPVQLRVSRRRIGTPPDKTLQQSARQSEVLAVLINNNVLSQSHCFAERPQRSVYDNLPEADRKSTRLNSSHIPLSRMPSSA